MHFVMDFVGLFSVGSLPIAKLLVVPLPARVPLPVGVQLSAFSASLCVLSSSLSAVSVSSSSLSASASVYAYRPVLPDLLALYLPVFLPTPH